MEVRLQAQRTHRRHASGHHPALGRPALAFVLLSLGTTHASLAAEPTFADIAPILRARCVICHAGDNAPLGLKLDNAANLLRGSTRGPVVKAGNPQGSELVLRLRGTKLPRMPLTGPPFLDEKEIVLVERWIAAGAPTGTAAAVASPPPAKPGPGERVTYAHVAPILLSRCVKCHTDNGLMGPAPEGYRLRTLAETLAVGERVRVVPGNPLASELVRRLRGLSTPRMPFDGPPYLAEADINLIERWIADGARDAEGRAASVPAGAAVRYRGRLTGEREIDGLPFRVDAATRMDRAPRIGGGAELRGVVEPDGSIRATRLRRR